MTIKKQFQALKENWLLVLLVIIVLAAVFFTNTSPGFLGLSSESDYGTAQYSTGLGMAKSYYPFPAQDFAPEIKDRIITKSSSLSIEAKTGKFQEADTRLKAIIQSTDSYLISENINSYDYGRRKYYSGNYNIKVAANKYSSVIEQLKNLGEVTSFNENSDDETAQYTGLKSEIEAEKSRLSRYQEMYKESAIIADKIQLSDKIFEQERLIKMYEESLTSLNNRVTYSTIYMTINEKQSAYSNIAWVKFSDLIKALVSSINSLASLLFIILPWAIAIAIIWIIIRLIRK